MVPDEESVAEYYEYRQQLDEMSADFREVIHHPSYSLPFLQPGRLVKVKHKDLDFGWGVVINYQKRLPPKVRPSVICFAREKPNLDFLVESTVPEGQHSASRAVCSGRPSKLRTGF